MVMLVVGITVKWQPSQIHHNPGYIVPSACLTVILSSLLCLRFNGHFPGEPELAGVYWSKGWWKWWWQLELQVFAKLQSNHHHQQTNTKSFFALLSPNQQYESTEGKISHSMDLLTQSTPGGLPALSLTTNSSWLPWGRVAMPLISPLIPVPQFV